MIGNLIHYHTTKTTYILRIDAKGDILVLHLLHLQAPLL